MNIDSIRSVYPRVVQAIDQAADSAWTQERDSDYLALGDLATAIAQAKGRVFCHVLNTVRQVAGLKRDEPTPSNFLRMVGKAVWDRVQVLDQLLN
jgi:hypothetical protein